jgi:hypothetical protein
MRPSPKHRLTTPAIALSLSCALCAFAPAAAAGASLTGELLPTVTVQAGPIATVEVSPTPRVEVPGVATVQAPSLPQPQLPVPPVSVPTLPVSTPSAPTALVTTPSLPATGTAPVSQAPGSRSSSGAPDASSSAAAGTHAAANAATAAGQPAQARSTSASAGTHRSSQHGARRRGASTAAAGSSGGSASAAATRAAVAAQARRAHPASHGSAAKPASSNPLSEIGRDIPFPVPVPDWSKPIILLLALVAAWFAVRSRLAAVRARRLERQRSELLGDLDVMQATLVPVIPRRLGDLSVSVAYQPADGPAAGGDFYDLFALQSNRVAIVLGDVAGHGRGALTQASLTRHTLRAYLKAGLEPRAALSLAGSVLAEPGEMQFATVVVAIYDGNDGRLTYASAGHPPPISIGFAVPEPLTVCCSAPICCDLPTGRRQTTLSVPAGGHVWLFSDGLPEARMSDGLLGRERLVELADGLDGPDSAAALLQRVRAEALATPDDMVACAISCATGARAQHVSVEELEVDREALARPSVAAFLQACGAHAGDVAGLLARAHELVQAHGTALLRVERPLAGVAAVSVTPGLAPTIAAPAIAGAGGSEEHALALAPGRAGA